MYSLSFDTTAGVCSILLQQGEQAIGRYFEEMDFGQSEALIPQIKNLLDANSLPFSQIGLVAVCVGPGSFTGVRTSISAARAFGIANSELVVSGVSAFDAYILSLKEEELADINAVIIETKREDFYYQLFDNKRNKISQATAAHYDDIIAELRQKKVSLIGDGVERFLSRPSGLRLHCIRQMDCLDIEKLSLCAKKQLENKKVDFPKPLYLRAPDVCLKQKI